MPIFYISAENASVGTIRCEHCWDNEATHIELSHANQHDPSEHVVGCEECARLAGLKPCEVCAGEAKVAVQAGNVCATLIPVYAPGELTNSRCGRHVRVGSIAAPGACPGNVRNPDRAKATEEA